MSVSPSTGNETGDRDLGEVGGCLLLPTLIVGMREGRIGKVLRDYQQHHRPVIAIARRSQKETIEHTKRLLGAQPELVFTGNPPMWILQGERIKRVVSLPTLRIGSAPFPG